MALRGWFYIARKGNKKPPGNNAPGGSNKERVLANI
jgi:hypothetical protein